MDSAKARPRKSPKKRLISKPPDWILNMINKRTTQPHLVVPILLEFGHDSWKTIAMIDSGATGNFISESYLDKKGLGIPCY